MISSMIAHAEQRAPYRWLVEAVASRDREGCWTDAPWRARRRGRPVATDPSGRQRKATHIVLELDGRVRPTPQHQALHTCDVIDCVNPAHLWWGTQVENMADMKAKGRGRGPSRPGELHPLARLTADEVIEIRRLAAAGTLHREIAAQFGLSKNYVGDLVRREAWRHLG